ncbi:MAG: Glycerol-3-phosphate dehydrogenase [NAD(P)+] [Alphaproteobacteria bacterium MarineAlpha3_Bin5]|nr:hypothetical protein [Magnetovibrio sp.]PPR76216.1 MAG: Glycerol-3-phosphate dehydrogenase [NAD(P)+] [Alphaproteobacteria bacterium MarineAlpha3_Bin5]|tara:strand:+ start:27 stop:1019 length:993 start_codon:yes stop_codon:yes gene_type:complete
MVDVSIVGAGSWGTALANVLADAGHNVLLHARKNTTVSEIKGKNTNASYLPNIKINPKINAVLVDLTAIKKSDVVFLVVPAQTIRTIAVKLASNKCCSMPLVICSKGIEKKSYKLLSEVLVEYLPKAPVAVLSGPTFAREVAAGLPTAVTIACQDKKTGNRLSRLIATPTFRTYYSNDIVGTQIGGAVKNILAIACGIVVARNFGENARAALISRGLAEMKRLAQAKGANTKTLMGLSGVGDLTLTCTSIQSRNYSFGLMLGKGETVDTISNKNLFLTEGTASALAVTGLASKLRVSMPICFAVNKIVNERAEITDTINQLLRRHIKNEV